MAKKGLKTASIAKKGSAGKSDGDWLKSVELAAKNFAGKYKTLLQWSDRQLSAAFEIGCFHALLGFYEGQSYTLEAINLQDGHYKYLTTPAGNPKNFSYVKATGKDGAFEIRQQVRVESHLDAAIAFTPDLVVVKEGAEIRDSKVAEYAGGKRSFFRVRSGDVIAAHECKSTNPFPELLIAFVGMFMAAHEWHPSGDWVSHGTAGGHLSPTLFVGGNASGLHLKMISAMQKIFRLNIVCGLHVGTWSLGQAMNRLAVGQISDDDLPF